MGLTAKKCAIFTCFIVVIAAPASATEQSVNVDADPMTLVIKHVQTDKGLTREKRGKPVTGFQGRDVAAGMEVVQTQRAEGGHYSSHRDKGAGIGQSSVLTLSLPVNSREAGRLENEILATYGSASLKDGGTRVWHVPNTRRKAGEPKIITIELKMEGNNQVFIVDKLPIEKRGRNMSDDRKVRARIKRNKSGHRNNGQALSPRSALQLSPVREAKL